MGGWSQEDQRRIEQAGCAHLPVPHRGGHAGHPDVDLVGGRQRRVVRADLQRDRVTVALGGAQPARRADPRCRWGVEVGFEPVDGTGQEAIAQLDRLGDLLAKDMAVDYGRVLSPTA